LSLISSNALNIYCEPKINLITRV